METLTLVVHSDIMRETEVPEPKLLDGLLDDIVSISIRKERNVVLT